jgi:AcrR family transcriptional regulator
MRWCVMDKTENSIENIMRSTVRVAFEKGFSNTRTADIAREAGVSEGLIYKYFPTKKDLFTMVIKDNLKRLKVGIEEIIIDQTCATTDKIRRLIDLHFNFFTIERNIGSLILGHSERMSLGGGVDSIVEYGLKPYVELVSQILNEGIARGEFRPLDTEQISTIIISAMQITLVTHIINKNTDDLEKAKKELEKYILAGIEA